MERVRQWDEIHDKPHIPDVETLQLAEYADYLRAPVSWVREHCEPSDIRIWADHQQIKSKRHDKQRAQAKAEANQQ